MTGAPDGGGADVRPAAALDAGARLRHASAAGVASSSTARRSTGGGAVGTGIGWLASRLADRRTGFGSPRPLPPPRAARCDLRLIGPLTGRRSTNTQPTYGTGLPPISRPSSKSHG